MAILYALERVNASKVLTGGLIRKLPLNYVGEAGGPHIPYIINIPIIYTHLQDIHPLLLIEKGQSEDCPSP